MSCTRNSDVTMSLELMPLYRRTCCRGYPQILTLKHQQTQTTQSKSESRSIKSPCLSSTGLNSLLGSVFSVIRPMRECDVTFDLLNLSPAVEGMIFARSAVKVSWLISHVAITQCGKRAVRSECVQVQVYKRIRVMGSREDHGWIWDEEMHYSQQTRPEDPMRADLNSTRSQNQSLPKLTLNTFK